MPKQNSNLCKEIREKAMNWRGYWKYNIDQYNEFFEFTMGGQWKDEEAKVFEDYKKIPLTVNKLGTMANHVVGEQRQNTPNLQIIPENGIPPEISEIRAALIKDISLSSEAKVVYQTAFQQALIGGFGAYRIGLDYEDDLSFHEKITINSVREPQKCFWDLGAENLSKTDGMFSGFQTVVTRKKVKALYGEEIERSIGTIGSDDSDFMFADDENIVFVNYYERIYKRIHLYELSNGRVVDNKELDAMQRSLIDDREFLLDQGMPVFILRDRPSSIYTVKHRLIAGDYELDSSTFPSQQLPLIYVDQNSYYDKKGKQICRPFFKDAKDAQRYLNYLATQFAYILKVARFDQFIGSKMNVRSNDTETIWRNPQVQQGMLVYDESPNGNKPEQLRPPELSGSMMQQYERAMMDLATSTGVYDTQMGQQGNEISGRAIDARTKRGSYNTYIVFDSLNRAIATGGQIIDEMIPFVYDTERTLMLNMPDTGLREVTINKASDIYGSQVENDITKGKYKIRLMPGPSFEGQKTEALESLQLILQANPQLFSVIADLFADNLPLPNNQEIKNRLRTIVPPEIIEAGKTGKPLPPKPQQPSPEILAARAKLQDIEIKKQKLQQDAVKDSEEIKLKMAQLELERQETAATLQESLLRFTAETHRTNTDAEMSHAENLIKLLTHHPVRT